MGNYYFYIDESISTVLRYFEGQDATEDIKKEIVRFIENKFIIRMASTGLEEYSIDINDNILYIDYIYYGKSQKIKRFFYDNLNVVRSLPTYL